MKVTDMNLDKELMFQGEPLKDSTDTTGKRKLTVRHFIIQAVGFARNLKDNTTILKAYRLQDRMLNEKSPYYMPEEELSFILETVNNLPEKRPAIEGQVLAILEDAQRNLKDAKVTLEKEAK